MEPIFTKKNDFRRRMESLVLTAQEKITEQLSKLDGNRFKRDKWFRKDGSGGGIVNYIQNGNCFEKGGINVSVSFGELPEAAQKHMLEKSEKISDYLKNSRDNVRFYSASMSSVIHPLNPHVPTIHFNYRYCFLCCDSGEFV
ncbi:hypothetical protein MHBO_005038 [Bonamia ostreae]|uniref:coproporphyrinogen oxidase n=1 Tax=Bonamia ostreae TaxID=126728 RepID=A0ABV2AUX2_9EUKA